MAKTLTLIVLEEKQMQKLLYKLEMLSLKIIPFILALCQFIRTICFILGISTPIFAELASVSLLPLLFLYLSSYTFKFCEYHRIPLHYIVLNNILNSLDYHFKFAISDYNFILTHSLLFGIASIICGILKLKKCQT